MPCTDEVVKFQEETAARLRSYHADEEWQALCLQWMTAALHRRYPYNFSFLGRPIIQLPQDMVAVQDLIWRVQPDLVIETGIAHGGSLIMSAGMLVLLDYCEAVQRGTGLDPSSARRRVIGVDIDIRKHNREAIEAHPLSGRIELLQGSSTDSRMISAVGRMAQGYHKVLVFLDSNHSHDHVLAELESYAPLVSLGSYCIVFDTIVEDMPRGYYPDRPWDRGNSPKTAVRAYLDRLASERINAADGDRLQFAVDEQMTDRLALTVSPGGFLKRI